jgi:two-component system, OmpR family, sensor histidine kinase VicK
MAKLIHILMVEGSALSAERWLEELRQGGYEPMSERVQTAKELALALSRHTWDVVLSNYLLPQLSGLDVLKQVRQRDANVPFIVISDVPGEEGAVLMIKEGANDFIIKSKLSLLVPAVENEIRAALSRRARCQAETMAQHFAEIVESSDDAIYGFKPDGTISSWNRAAERFYGYRAGEIIGRNISMLYPDERLEELVDTMERIKRGDHPGCFESARVRKGGREIPVSVTVSPVMMVDGKVAGGSAIARDITFRRRNEVERTKLIDDLTQALNNARMLSGLLPICACCKQIRDDRGDWHQMEAYITDHSQAVFSHGICPGCFKEARAGIDNHEVRVAVG